MATFTRTTALLTGLIAAFASYPSTSAVAADEPPQLVLLVHDYVGVRTDTRAAASETVHRIYGAAGVHTVWVDRCLRADCHRTERASSVDTAARITVNIYSREMTPIGTSKHVMGSAPEGTYFAWVFFEHVRAFASLRDLVPAIVLGHVIAHEVGHLLLRDGHAESGIMRGKWSDRDLLEARRGRLGFTSGQAERIREYVSRLNVENDRDGGRRASSRMRR